MSRLAVTVLLFACGIAACGCGARSNLLGLQSDPQNAPAADGGGVDAPPADAIPEAAIDALPTSDAQQDVVVVSSCPSVPPELNGPCGTLGQVCAYATGKVGPCDDVGTDDRVAWRCEDHGWLEIARCVDWGSCPDTAPSDGDPCDASLVGLDCFYSSSDACTPGSIAQCDGEAWRQVNACLTRVPPAGFALAATLTGDEITAVIHPEQQVEYPALALAGTQLLMTHLVSAGYAQERGIYGHLLQTAADLAPTSHVVAPEDELGVDPVSAPRVTHRAGMFTLAWGADDGWPVHTDGVPGLYVRNVPLHAPPYSSPLVDDQGSAPNAVVMQPSGGRVAYRYPVPGTDNHYAAAVVALSATGEPAPLTKVTLADETVSEWFAPPVPVAIIRIAPWQQGFVYVFPVIASGDLWDDSGIALLFYSTGDAWETPVPLRITVGMPRRLSVATLSDGSVIVAYAGVDWTQEGGAPFRLVQARSDGTWIQLPDPPQPGVGEDLGSGPVVVPFEDGFAVGWTSIPLESPGAVARPRVMVRAGGFLAQETTWDGGALHGMVPSDQLDLAWCQVDRTLHVAWEHNGSLSVIERQRLVVRPF